MKIISWSVGFIPWGYLGRYCCEYRIYDNIVSNAVYKDTVFFLQRHGYWQCETKTICLDKIDDSLLMQVKQFLDRTPMTLRFPVQCFVDWAIKQNGKLVEQDRQIYSSVDWESFSRAVLIENVKRPLSVLPVALRKCKKSQNSRDKSNSEPELRKNLSWWCQPGLLFDLARTRFLFLPANSVKCLNLLGS